MRFSGSHLGQLSIAVSYTMNTPSQVLPRQIYPTAAAAVLKIALAGRLGLAARAKMYLMCSVEMLSM